MINHPSIRCDTITPALLEYALRVSKHGVFVVFAPSLGLCIVPRSIQYEDDGLSGLKYSQFLYSYRSARDLAITVEGVHATFSFGGHPFDTFIAWSAILLLWTPDACLCEACTRRIITN